MVVETSKGKYELVKNNRDAFNKEQFEEKYIEECFDKYPYLVGDISSGILRIKGFTGEQSGLNSFKLIPDYLYESCAFSCAYFILKRI